MRRILISTTLLAVLSLTVWVSVRPARSQSKPKAAKAIAAATPSYGNMDAISEEEMKIYLYFLASDQLEGRNLPSRGFDTAALYVASHLAEWGLKPGGSTTNTVGPLQPYLMPFELVSKQVVPEQSKASITAPPAAGGRGGRGGGGGGGARGGAASTTPRTTDFEYTKDWTVNAGGRGAPPLEALDVTGNLVFAGNGYVINKTKVNPYDGLDVKGKIVVVAGLPAELAAQQAAAAAGGRGAEGRRGGAQRRGAGGRNPLGEACTDFLTPEQYAAKNGALAVVTIANFQQLAAMANPNAAAASVGLAAAADGARDSTGRPIRCPNCSSAPACAGVPSITAGLAMTNSIFQGEKQSATADFLRRRLQHQTGFLRTVRREENQPESGDQERVRITRENVIGILEGSDPVLKNEYVVISAHLDHIGLAAPLPDGHNVNNGADDDGSGSAGLLALARVIRGRRRQGNPAQAQHRLRCGWRAKRKACGARNTSPSIPSSISPKWWPT